MVKPRSGRSPLQPFIQAMVSFKDKLNFHWILLWKNIRITNRLCLSDYHNKTHFQLIIVKPESKVKAKRTWSRFRPELDDTNILRYYDCSFTHPRVIDNCYLPTAPQETRHHTQPRPWPGIPGLVGDFKLRLLWSSLHSWHLSVTDIITTTNVKALWLFIISRKMSSTAINRATAATTVGIFFNKMTATQEKAGPSH